MEIFKRSAFIFVYVMALASLCHSFECNEVVDSDKVDCGYAGIDEDQCLSEGCCWSPEGQNSQTPWCYKRSTGETSAYTLKNLKKTDFGYAGELNVAKDNGQYGTALTQLKLEVVFQTASTFRVRVTDANSERYEIPQSVIKRQMPPDVKSLKESDLDYEFTYKEDPFTFEVKRKSDGMSLFNMDSDLVFKDQFIQLSTWYDTGVKTYGIGESTRLEQALQIGTTKTLWAADIPAAGMYNNLYGSFPYYLQVNKGKAHGAMLMNSNGMDVELAANKLSFRTIGGMIDLYVFSGDSPDAVVRQYTEVVGKPMMMPYWSLGFHNCKYGYTGVAQVEEVVQGYQDAGIPLDTQWMDIDYMEEYRDFTWSASNFNQQDVAKFVDGLHSDGLHFVPIIDPGIMVYSNYPAYDDGMKKDLFVRDLTGESPYLAQVWPGPVYFPDFLNPATQSYWTEQIRGFWEGVNVDGLWIDMNEVSNFCNVDGQGQVCKNENPSSCPSGNIDTQCDCCLTCSEVDSTNNLDYPPYRIGNHQGNGNLGVKTLPASSLHYMNETTYNVHNLYGLTEQIATNEALTQVRGERPFLLTRSSFLSSGAHTAKWSGDNAATWSDLQSSIVTMNDFNLFGVPMIGSDICGFLGDTTEELCARWIEVGAFYPFSRNHNSLNQEPQELYLWDSVTAAAKTALGMRYKMLPFLYSLFYNAHSQGTTVARSLWYNFPADEEATNINFQFMLGKEILVSPVVTEGATSVLAYFPKGQLWYDFSSLALSVDASEFGVSKEIDTPLESVNVHIRGGSVVPLQQGGMTTTESVKTPFTLVVALCTNNGAFGNLFMDDGTQTDIKSFLEVDFHAKDGKLTATVNSNSYQPASSLPIEAIKIVGKNQSVPSKVTLNGQALDASQWSMDTTTAVLTVTPSLKIVDAFELTWE